MEQYSVPQFIEQESRIIFFLSFKQFFYLIGGGLICFFLFYLIPSFELFMIASFIVMATSAALAFIQINGMTLPVLILNSLGFIIGGKSYIWKKKEMPYTF